MKDEKNNIMSNRIAFSDIFCGVNATGKTTKLKECISHLVKKGNRVLIVTPDPIEWRDITEIKQNNRKEIKTFKGVRRIIYDDSCMDDIRKYLHNAVLVLDDCRVYIGNQRDDVMAWLQIRRRQIGIDLYCVFHGLTEVPVKFFTFTSRLFLFYTIDNIIRRNNCLSKEMIDLINTRKKIIDGQMRAGNRYYFEIITLDIRFKK